MKYIITENQYRLINEEVSPSLKDFIFNKLLEDMKGAELIEDKFSSIWAIDPDEKYWYFVLLKDGTLWWRPDFFHNFFRLFSMGQKEFEPLIRDMVGDILNRKVGASSRRFSKLFSQVGDILNRKVGTSGAFESLHPLQVGDILNHNKKKSEEQNNPINEEVNPRIKEIIFNKLLNDMKGVEIIEDNGSIWAIDPDEKYWYFELEKDGTLWWRWDFFNNFFKLFSMEREEYEPLIRDMVGDILNRKAVTSRRGYYDGCSRVEDILNRKVVTSHACGSASKRHFVVGDILNRNKKKSEEQNSPINEEVSPRIKEIIFNKLLEDMKGAELIEDRGSIWAIDPDEKYWYFELEKDGALWWRSDFFSNFFRLFSLERDEYEPLIRDMVEDILNRKVGESWRNRSQLEIEVGDILNRKVGKSTEREFMATQVAQDILNRNKK